MANRKGIPLIKEYRIGKLKRCLRCIDEYPFDRDRQRECILMLYPGKSEKSVFRGMVIPSLRHLGLIVGYGEHLRMSGNGKLIVESELMSQRLHRRVLRAVIHDIDQNTFRFIDVLKNKGQMPIEKFFQRMNNIIVGPSKKQKRERVSHWLSVLAQVELVCHDAKSLSLSEQRYDQTLSDAQTGHKKKEKFKKHLFDAYFKLGQETAGVVDIADLRNHVGVKMLREDSIIFTERQFDEMLKQIPFATDDYIISFGRPMGAEEQLFKYNDKYFRTLSIQLFKQEAQK